MKQKPINLVLDWDGTITRTDTMFAMAAIVSSRDKRLGNSSSAAEQWEGFGKVYMEDYAAHEDSYVPAAQDRLDSACESAWLKSLDVVESQSVNRVEQSNFFRGVKREDVLHAANDLHRSGQVSLRPGWDRLFARAKKVAADQPSPVSLSILSVNWSEAFIRASLNAAAGRSVQESEAVSSEQIDNLEILTNEIDGLDDPEGSSGRLNVDSRPGIRTSFDKLQNLKRDPDSINVYVGDSATDFDCLLAADVGICIRDRPMGSSQRALAGILDHLDVLPIKDVGRLKDWSWPRLCSAKDLGEVDDLLSRLHSAEG